MNCNQVRHLLSAYLDRELRPEEERRVRLHLAECTCCEAAYQEEKAIKELLGSLPEVELPPGWWEKLDRRLEEADSALVQWRSRLQRFATLPSRWWRSVAVAAVVLLLVLPFIAQRRGVTVHPDAEDLSVYHYTSGSGLPLQDQGAIMAYYLRKNRFISTTGLQTSRTVEVKPIPSHVYTSAFLTGR